MALKAFRQSERTPQPTAPTATTTPTVPPTATLTPSTTPTLPPSATPTVTPTPTNTPVPFPVVRFEQVAPLGEPELVTVKNSGTAPQDMTNWRIFEKRRGRTCYFPNGLVLAPDETHTISSGRGSVAGPDVTVCDASNLLWDNNLDEAQLWNASNTLVDRWCYDRNGSYICEEE
jgi:hypothetical protein